MAKRIKLVEITTVEGKPFKIPDRSYTPAEGEPPRMLDTTDLGELLRLLVYNIPRARLSMQDAINGADLIHIIEEYQAQAPDARSGILELTEGLHDWLKKTVDSYAPAVFGVHAAALKQAVDNFERANEPAAKG